MIQDLFIVGATGNVGGELIKQIEEKGNAFSSNLTPQRIVGIASSQNFLFIPQGLSTQQIQSFIDGDSQKAPRYTDLEELVDEANRRYRENGSRLVVVDVTSHKDPMNNPLTHLHLHLIGKTHYGVATANKDPVALSHIAVFQQLTLDPTRYEYSCSVMAGAEAVSRLRDSRFTMDILQSMEGCFSGTLGYIASELEKGKKFSEALNEAMQLGYTESDPRADLSGLDVARKVIVLGRTAGYKVGIEDVKLEPFIPKEYIMEGESIEDFLKRVHELDEYFERKMKYAQEHGMTLRYVARMDIENGKPKVEVSLREVPLESQLGSLKGRLNQIIIVSKRYPQENPYSIRAPGAGLEITAGNIRRDLLYLPGGMFHQSATR